MQPKKIRERYQNHVLAARAAAAHATSVACSPAGRDSAAYQEAARAALIAEHEAALIGSICDVMVHHDAPAPSRLLQKMDRVHGGSPYLHYLRYIDEGLRKPSGHALKMAEAGDFSHGWGSIARQERFHSLYTTAQLRAIDEYEQGLVALARASQLTACPDCSYTLAAGSTRCSSKEACQARQAG